MTPPTEQQKLMPCEYCGAEASYDYCWPCPTYVHAPNCPGHSAITTPPSAGEYQELVEALLVAPFPCCREAADAIRTLIAREERLRGALMDWRNSWLCPVGPFDADRLLRLTDSILELTPIAAEYE